MKPFEGMFAQQIRDDGHDAERIREYQQRDSHGVAIVMARDTFEELCRRAGKPLRKEREN